jgi:hypothetical protein
LTFAWKTWASSSLQFLSLALASPHGGQSYAYFLSFCSINAIKHKFGIEHDIMEPNAGPPCEEPEKFGMSVFLRAQGLSYIGNISNKRLFHLSKIKGQVCVTYQITELVITP